MAKRNVEFMITAFRDGFQSVYGARVLTPDFLPAVQACVHAGIRHFEAGGGARFQSLYFYCDEDAFDMMDAFRRTAGPDANLQTLARGINVVGLDSQPRDIIRLHAQLFAKHGVTTIRNFDALNDVDNLVYSGRCISEAGLHHEVCVTLMELPPGCEGAHTPDFYVRVLQGIVDAEIPFSSVCFKDASGTSVPSTVHETVRRARRLLPGGTRIVFHTHDTAGIGVMACKAALDGGADQIDLSMAPVSGGTCQPDIVSLWHALRGSDYTLDVDINKILEAEGVFKDCMKDYFVPPEAKSVEPLIPFSPMPGGALTANTQMMRDNGILNRYPEVIAAMPEVVRRGGFGTSVTPVSQFYFQQAFNNVMFGPWKKVAEGYGKMVLGYFGRTPVPPDPRIVELASAQLGLEPTTRSPLDINDEDPTKGAATARALLEAESLPVTDENTFIAATCLAKGVAYLKGEAKLGVRKQAPAAPKPSVAAARSAEPEAYTVTVNGRQYVIEMDGDSRAQVDGRSFDVAVAEGRASTDAPKAGRPRAREQRQPVPAQMPGAIVRVAVATGDVVAEGELLVVQEAMKMEVDVRSPWAGVVDELVVGVGDVVAAGDVLVWTRSEDAR